MDEPVSTKNKPFKAAISLQNYFNVALFEQLYISSKTVSNIIPAGLASRVEALLTRCSRYAALVKRVEALLTHFSRYTALVRVFRLLFFWHCLRTSFFRRISSNKLKRAIAKSSLTY
jgi:hypothetical protein